MAGQMVQDGPADAATATRSTTGKLVTRDTARNALGTNVDGYVLPMFHSQTALAYNPALVPNPPKTYDELVAWAQANPRKFGYNGIKGGMSGRRLRVRLGLRQLAESGAAHGGALRSGLKTTWAAGARRAEGVQPERRHHAGQCRHARHAQPRRDRDGAGLGRHVLYLAGRRPAAARHAPAAHLAGNAGPADVLRHPGQGGECRGWRRSSSRSRRARRSRPKASSSASTGIPASTRSTCSPISTAPTWEKLFKDVSPQDLSAKGKPMPIGEYFKEIQEAYERQVAN